MIVEFFFAAFLFMEPDTLTATQLLQRAQAAGDRFVDRNAAIRAGYRRIGPDIPEMGEHWVKPMLLLAADLDPDRPAILTYAQIGGRPTLTGVAYALALRAGEAAPALPSGLHWHDHTADIAVELRSGIGMNGSRPRLAMLHVWTRATNPAGSFVESNWTLPYLRLGLMPPGRLDADAARALSLVTVGEKYYTELLQPLNRARSAEVATVIAEFTAKVRARIVDVDTEANGALAGLWHELRARVSILLGPDAARSLGSPERGHH